MIIRRQYFANRHYGYKYHPEIKTWHELCQFMEDNPDEPTWALDNATYFYDKLEKSVQVEMWKGTLRGVMQNTRWYLDHLNQICEYKVWWNYYGKKKTIGKPPIELNMGLELCEIQEKTKPF